MKQIIVEINMIGEVKIDAIGYKGMECSKATAAIEAALGKTTARQHKPEAHTQTQTQTKAGH